MNEFAQDLKFSTDASTQDFWFSIYERAFHNMVKREVVEPGFAHWEHYQRQGIDSVITLSNHRMICIDEKVRRKKWNDIALEIMSNKQKGTPGWMNKDLTIDYLAYAFLPTQEVYLYPWPMLKRAWGKYHNQWLVKYGKINAANKVNGRFAYTTVSCPVPIDVLNSSVSEMMHIRL